MRKKLKSPFVPVERRETVRKEIISVLAKQILSSKDISAIVRVSEKEVYGHLEHIQKTMNKTDHRLRISPAECVKCGFTFRKRDKLKKPGKCPVCRNEQIREPLFSIEIDPDQQ